MKTINAAFLFILTAGLQACYLNHDQVPADDAGLLDDADAVPFGGSVAVVCEPRTTELLTGTSGRVFEMRVIPGDRPVFMREARFSYGCDGRTLWGTVFGYETGRPYFTEWNLIADFPLRIFNSDRGVIVPSEEERRGRVSFDMSPWTEGPLAEPTTVALYTTVSEREEGLHTLTLGRYTASLERLTFAYGDTGEPVPESEVSMRGCDRGDQVARVLANYAQIIVDRDSGFEAPEARGSVTDHPSMRLAVLNDGARSGTLTGFTLGAHMNRILADGRELPGEPNFVTRSCSLFQDDVRIARGVPTVQDHFRFSGFSIPVPDRLGPGDFLLEIRCDLDPSALYDGESARIALSAPYDELEILEPDPAHVQGTLVLAQNHLQPPGSRVSVLLRP